MLTATATQGHLGHIPLQGNIMVSSIQGELLWKKEDIIAITITSIDHRTSTDIERGAEVEVVRDIITTIITIVTRAQRRTDTVNMSILTALQHLTIDRETQNTITVE